MLHARGPATLLVLSLSGGLSACTGVVGDGHDIPNGFGSQASAGAQPAGGSGPSGALPAADPNAPGMLDCPTVNYPGSTETRLMTSPTFQRVCGTCHGAAGEGKGSYPPVPGKLTKQQFLTRVRTGSQNMPAFGADLITDADLASDWEALETRTNGDGIVRVHPALSWTPEQVAAKRQAGLIAWRKPGTDGAACANCHSPDAIDLAAIGYPDEAIMRRGLVHLAPEDALAVVDFVHAQRRQFNIQRPCSPDWHAMQPGGAPLPGDTVQEQDAALFDELVRRGLLIATGSVDTVGDADRAWNELATLNLRKMPIGIPTPRWTEDLFDGEGHKTINDWISSVPRIPNGAGWYQDVDAYLADPTLDKMVALLGSVADKTADGGFSKKQWADGDPSAVFTSKYHATQLASHYFRMALTNRPGWFEQSEQPPAVPITRGETYNPFNAIGFAYQENHCYNVQACPPGQYDALPSIAQIEFDPTVARAAGSSGGSNFSAQMQSALTHPWWTLAGLFDPTFGGGRPMVMHYWLEFGSDRGVNFPHRTYHRPFLMAVAMVKRAVAVDGITAASGVPGLLHGSIVTGFENPIGSTIGETPQNTRMISNIMRMVLLRMQRELSAGKGTSLVTALVSGNGLGDWPTNLESAAKKAGGDVVSLTATANLAREVLGMLAKAPVVAIPIP